MIEKLKKKDAELRKKYKEAQIKKEKIESEYREQIEKLDKEIDKLRKKMVYDTADLEKEMGELNEQVTNIEREIYEIGVKEATQKFLETGEITMDFISGLLGIGTGYSTKEIDISPRGGKLSNGIRIVRIQEINIDEITRYLAFYKNKLIGMWIRRKAEHQGDYTTPDSFITLDSDKIPTRDPEWGGIFDSLMKCSDGKILLCSETNGYSWQGCHHLLFNEWKALLKALTEEELENAVGIDLKDEENLKYIQKNGWVD